MKKKPALNTATRQEILEAAFGYTKLGLGIFPCVPGGKHPLTEHGHKDASTDAPTIIEWWKRTPQANVGLALPDSLVVVDVDELETVEKVMYERGLTLPRTASVQTGKGFHNYYALPPGVKIPNYVRPIPGLDVRATGGYVLVPPSLHPSGFRYKWTVGLKELAPAPTWLLQLAQPIPGFHTTPVEEWRRVIRTGARLGERANTITRIAGFLLRRRVDPWVVLELLLAFNESRCHPPLVTEEVVKTVNSIAGREARRRRRDW